MGGPKSEVPPLQQSVKSSNADSFYSPSRHHLPPAPLSEPGLPGHLAHLGESGPARSVPGPEAGRAEKGAWAAEEAAWAA